MTERPILFSGPMVKAILDGTKTQTRRVIKPQPIVEDGELRFPWASFFDFGHVHTFDKKGVGGENWNAPDYPNENKFAQALKRTPYKNPCPYGIPWDELYVRETFRHFGNLYRRGMMYEQVTYQADGATREIPYFHTGDGKTNPPVRKWWNTGKAPWTSGRFIPRRYSRIQLEITEVRVERVQDISEEDARAEGIEMYPYPVACDMARHPKDDTRLVSPQSAFASLWDSINSKRGFGWDINPFVWVISFRRIRP